MCIFYAGIGLTRQEFIYTLQNIVKLYQGMWDRAITGS